jgi:succinate dehydrogenase/fumarate reductase flavoprotein subunit
MSTANTTPEPHAAESRVSRRAFLKAAGSGTLLTAATAATVVVEESAAFAERHWDHEADVAVVGSGAAAASAALFAHEGGAKVLMVEKAAIFGGTSRKSGGGYWIPNNYLMKGQGLTDPREDCIRYMARTAYPTLYNPGNERLGLPEVEHGLLTAFYDNAAPVLEALRTMGTFDKHVFWVNQDGEFWPDYYAQLPENKAPKGRTLFPAHPDGSRGNGAYMMELMQAAVEKRKIPVLLRHRATRLVVNARGEIVGLEATTDDRMVAIRARKGVIFGSGGFTSNPELSLSFLRGPIFGGCTVPSGQGDFVHIGAAAGAKLANMANAWWWPVMLEQALQFRSTPGGIGQPSGDSMITVNRFGRRVVNEWIQYNERNQAHFAWDPHTCSYPNLIMFIIYDQFTRDRFAETSGLVVRQGIKAPYILSGQTLEELAAAIDKRLAEVADRTGGFRLDQHFAANLKDTIARFNQFAETGVDLDFHRGEAPIEQANFGKRRPGNDKPNKMMYPIRPTGPYYTVMAAGGTLDTKGGPKINGAAQVLNVDNKPIAGLYGAGNCIAAPAGQAYWAGGSTLGPALTFGALAGRHAAAAGHKELT